MNLSDELQKLQNLHWSGALTDAEYARAKERLLSGGPATTDPAVYHELADLHRQDTVRRLDDEWRLERESFLIRGTRGRPFLPNKFMAVGSSLMAVLFGGLWTALAFSITGGMPGGFGPIRLFPLVGLVFIGAGVAFGWYAYTRAGALEKAEARYRQRRAELLDKPAGEPPP
jgi:hypothetical protein